MPNPRAGRSNESKSVRFVAGSGSVPSKKEVVREVEGWLANLTWNDPSEAGLDPRSPRPETELRVRDWVIGVRAWPRPLDRRGDRKFPMIVTYPGMTGYPAAVSAGIRPVLDEKASKYGDLEVLTPSLSGLCLRWPPNRPLRRRSSGSRCRSAMALIRQASHSRWTNAMGSGLRRGRADFQPSFPRTACTSTIRRFLDTSRASGTTRGHCIRSTKTCPSPPPASPRTRPRSPTSRRPPPPVLSSSFPPIGPASPSLG
jgi:hypothetical protein